MTAADDNSWLRLAAIGELELDFDNDVTAVSVAGHQYALYRIDKQWYVTDNHCSHARAPLCEGYLDGFFIECPLHQGRFDIRTGKAKGTPAIKPVRSYPVRVTDDNFLEINRRD